MKWIGPKNKYGNSWKKFNTEEDFKGFKGWFIQNCGIKLNLAEYYKEEIDYFNNLPEYEKENLIYKIQNRVRYF